MRRIRSGLRVLVVMATGGSVALPAQLPTRLFRSEGGNVAIDMSRVPRGRWTFASTVSGTDGSRRSLGVVERMTVVDSVVAGRAVVSYRVVTTGPSGDSGVTSGAIDRVTGRVLMEAYNGRDGRIRAIGDPAFRETPMDLVLDSVAVTDAQLPLLLAALPLGDSVTWWATIQRIDPRARGPEVSTVRISRIAGGAGRYLWRIDIAVEDRVRSLLLDASDRSLSGRETVMFDGRVLSTSRQPQP